MLSFLRLFSLQPELVHAIKVEFAKSAASRRNQTIGSELLQTLLLTMRNFESSCYKRKRDGTPSSAPKAALSLVRESIADDLQKFPSRATCVSALLEYATAMNDFKTLVLTECPKLHSEFVDKFVKLQLRDGVLTQWRGDFENFATFDAWRRDVLEQFRVRCNVPLTIRREQQERTNDNRDRGLRYPTPVSLETLDRLADWLKSFVYRDNEIVRNFSTAAVTAALCLLQLGCGGRARDVILVNVIEAVDDKMIRVQNITKRKLEGASLEITKPVLQVAFKNSDSFMELLCRVRVHITNKGVQEGFLTNAMVATHTNGVCHMDYQLQFDKNPAVESLVQSWASRMRRLLHSTGYGTHFLRKLYVVASYAQDGKEMKEPAWAQSVLGHNQYETSLLYTSVQICDSNKK